MEIDVDNVSEPEPSSPRRTTRPISAKQEVATTSSGGSNASGCSSNNYNKTYKNAQYELVDGVPQQQQQLPPQIQTQQPKNPNRNMSTYRNNTENWYNSTSSNNNGPVTKTNNIRVHQKSMSNRIMSLKRENKTTQTLAIVVGGFIACWLPFFIAYLITPFLDKNAIGDGVSAFLTWLGWFNSAMNPFIYALYSVDFRAAFWRLTCRRFCKNFRKAPYASNTYSIRRTWRTCSSSRRIIIIMPIFAKTFSTVLCKIYLIEISNRHGGKSVNIVCYGNKDVEKRRTEFY